MIGWTVLASLAGAWLSQKEQRSAPVHVAPFTPLPISLWCGPEFTQPGEQYGGYEWIPPWMGLEWLFLPDSTKRGILNTHLENARPWRGDCSEHFEPWLYDPAEDEDYDEDYSAHFDPWYKDADWPIQASSWKPFDPFPEVEPGDFTDLNMFKFLSKAREHGSKYAAISPSGRWVYVKRKLPRGHKLEMYVYDEYEYDTVRGSVVFDDEVVIPVIYEGNTLWMSHTPQEITSQAEAVCIRAENKVILCGLGLGWSLVKLANNKRVTEVILVEKNPELVNWILPRLCRWLPKDKPIHVVIGDAYEVLPHLDANMALVDIWPEYTEIEDDMEVLMASSPGIRKWWGWGLDWPRHIFRIHM